MTKLNASRLIQMPNLTFHVDYVCGLEYREGFVYITFKQGGYAKDRLSKKEFLALQDMFMGKGTL